MLISSIAFSIKCYFLCKKLKVFHDGTLGHGPPPMPLCPRFYVTVGESTITAHIMESELSVHLTESPMTLGGSTKQMLRGIHTPVSILCAQCLAQS